MQWPLRLMRLPCLQAVPFAKRNLSSGSRKREELHLWNRHRNVSTATEKKRMKSD